MTTVTTEIEKPTSNPLEELLDIEPNTTLMPAIKRETELVVDTRYDSKDTEIEDQFQEIYDLALEAFDAQSQEAELVEGKYKYEFKF